MIIFRPSRELLDESMAEAKEFNTVEEMKAYIVKLWHDGLDGTKELFNVDDIVINVESAVNDDRIGWQDTMSVCLKRLGDEDFIKKYNSPQCIGKCATKYIKTN